MQQTPPLTLPDIMELLRQSFTGGVPADLLTHLLDRVEGRI